jgi:hypothetical protein
MGEIMNITIATMHEYYTIIDEGILEQMTKSIFKITDDNNIEVVQTYKKEILDEVNKLQTSNELQLNEKNALIKFFEELEDGMKYACAKVFIDCQEDKAVKYLSVFCEKIDEGRTEQHAKMIASNDMGEGFSIGKYFNKPCDFSPMFTPEGYIYYTYASQRFTHLTMELMEALEEYIQDDLYLRYEIIKYPAKDEEYADWDYCIVLHALTLEQKNVLIEYEQNISK